MAHAYGRFFLQKPLWSESISIGLNGDGIRPPLDDCAAKVIPSRSSIGFFYGLALKISSGG